MKQKIKSIVIETVLLGRIVFFFYRIKIVSGYLLGLLPDFIKWLFRSNEITNFTYDLEKNNKRYLASLIADVAEVDYSLVDSYIKELEEDNELRLHIIRSLNSSDKCITQ